MGYRDHYVVAGGKARILLSALMTLASIMDNIPSLCRNLQHQFLPGGAVTFDMLDPGPSDRDGTLAVGQADDQELMA
jgi:hypothetical protein